MLLWRGVERLVERSMFTLIEEDAATWRRVPCGRTVWTDPSTPGLRPFGRDDGGEGPTQSSGGSHWARRV